MILPNSANFAYTPSDVVEFPTYTYKIDFRLKRIVGFVDQRDAMVQATEKLFSTERFAYVIYSDLYGIQLEELIGAPMDYVQTVLRSRIESAISVDDRFTGIVSLETIVVAKDSLEVRLTLGTIYGNIPYTLEVPV